MALCCDQNAGANPPPSRERTIEPLAPLIPSQEATRTQPVRLAGGKRGRSDFQGRLAAAQIAAAGDGEALGKQ